MAMSLSTSSRLGRAPPSKISIATQKPLLPVCIIVYLSFLSSLHSVPMMVPSPPGLPSWLALASGPHNCSAYEPFTEAISFNYFLTQEPGWLSVCIFSGVQGPHHPETLKGVKIEWCFHPFFLLMLGVLGPGGKSRCYWAGGPRLSLTTYWTYELNWILQEGLAWAWTVFCLEADEEGIRELEYGESAHCFG